MSSKLKDARWQLASEMAADDGFNFWGPYPQLRVGYLETARERLQGQSEEFIDRLAKRYREEEEA